MANALLGLLTLNSPHGHCVGQWTLAEHRPCPRCQRVPTTGGFQFPQPSGCSVPHTPYLKPGLEASAEASKGDSGEEPGVWRRGLPPASPPRSPSPHFILFLILHSPTGRPPPSESLLLAEGNALFFGLTQQLLSLRSRSHSLLYSRWLSQFPHKTEAP